MTKGVLLFAQNNSQIDYVKQAIFCASRIKKYLDLPVCLVTDNTEYLNSQYSKHAKYFDSIIEIEHKKSTQRKKYHDGLYSHKSLEWNNLTRSDCYDLTPFDETIVMDTDVIVSNNKLLECFNSKQDFLITKQSQDVKNDRYIPELKRISDKSISMYWATLFYFKKNENTKVLFDTIKYIRDNWQFYRITYKITEKKFRNDFAFSIAIHIINGFRDSNWPLSMPGTLWHTLDKDILVDLQETQMSFLLANDYKYYVATVKDCNVHVMNKFSLNRIINDHI